MGITVAAFAYASPAVAQGNGSSPKGKPFVAINDQIVEVQGAVTDLQDQINDLVARVDTIEDRVGANEDAIAALQAVDTYLASLIAINATDIATINSEIDALQAENVDLQAQITANDGDIAAHQAQIDLNETAISTLQACVLQVENGLISLDTDLQGQIDAHAVLIGALEDEIDLINDDLAMKQMLVSGSCPAGSSIREILPSGGVVCEIDDVGGGGSSISQYRVYTYRTVYQNSSGSLYAYCPTGFALTGGGSQGYSGSQAFHASRPLVVTGSANSSDSSNRAWYAYLSRPAYSSTLYAMAICIRHN